MSVQTSELVAETPYIWRARRPESTQRLICLPHAGAGAAAYADWIPLLPPEIELVAVQLPGRQNRIAEEPFTAVGPLVSTLTHALRPVLDRPYAIFGHSCGAASRSSSPRRSGRAVGAARTSSSCPPSPPPASPVYGR